MIDLAHGNSFAMQSALGNKFRQEAAAKSIRKTDVFRINSPASSPSMTCLRNRHFRPYAHQMSEFKFAEGHPRLRDPIGMLFATQHRGRAGRWNETRNSHHQTV
jgi:hypothetical protein